MRSLLFIGCVSLGFGLFYLWHPEVDSNGYRYKLIIWGIGFILLCCIPLWWKLRCPACKKSWAMKKKKTQVVNMEQYSAIVELDQRDRNGNFIGTRQEAVPGVRTTYKMVYQCKHCGHIKEYTKVKEKENIVRR